MSATKQYSIVINGIKESTDAVDALMKQLDALEKRIDTLNNKGVSISKAVGGKTSDLSAEQKIADQINQSIEKRTALQGELGKQLAQEKQLMKEVNAEAKALAAKDRLDNAGYGNTMMGMKQELADIKAAMQVMDVSSNEFMQATQRADELNNKLKEIEQSYGQFGRNVGNYSGSIQEAFQQITVKVGDTEMKFNSTKEALRTLREGVKGMVVNGQEGTEEFKNMSDALHNLEMAADRADSAVQDLQKSSTGMDAALDWMQSFGALGQISQGFSTLFGGTGFEESIQKLMSLQSVLQGIEKIREQMNTGEGFGGMFGKASKSIDTFVAKLTGAKIGMNGLEASTKSATLAVKGLSLAIKAIGTAGVMIALDWLIDKLQEVGKLFGNVKNSAVDSIDGMDMFAQDVAQANKELEKQTLLLQLKEAKGEISKEESRRQQIELTNKALGEQYEQLKLIMDLNDSDDAFKNISKGMNDLSMISPTNLEKTMELWGDMKKAVQTNQDVYSVLEEKADSSTEKFKNWASSMLSSAEDTKEGFAGLSQNMAGQLGGIMNYVIQNYQKMADGGKGAITQLINAMNDGGLINNFLTNLPALLGEKSEQVMAVLGPMISQIRNIGVSMGIPGAKSTDDTIDDYRKQLKKIQDASTKSAKATQKATLDVEKETQKMRLDLMAEGYLKELTRLKQERDDQLRRYKGHNDLMLKAEEVYQKKSKDLREKYDKEARESYKQLWYDIYSYTEENIRQQSDIIEQEIQKIKDLAEKGRQPSQYGGNTLFNLFTDDVRADLVRLTDEMAGAIASGMEKGSAVYKAKVEELRKTIGKDYGEVFDLNRWLQVKTVFGENIVPTFEKLADLLYDIQKTTSTDSFLPIQGEDRIMTVLNDDLSVYLNNIEDIKNTYGQLLRRFNESWQGKTFDMPELWNKYEELFEKQKELLDKQREEEARANGDWWNEQDQKTREVYDQRIQLAQDNAEELAKIEKEKEEALNRITDEAMDRQTAIYQKYDLKQEELERNKNKDRLESFRGYVDAELQETRDLYDRMSKVMDDARTPNNWGIINLGKIGKAADNTKGALEAARTELQKLLGNIYSMRDKISADDYKRMSKEILDMLEEIDKKMQEVGAEPIRSISDFVSQLNVYVSAVASSIQQVWGEIDNLLNYDLDRQQDALDKENEMLQKKLDEQEEILERHRQRVEDIEGKLSEARGDRREALIDALNAEILAQRRAQAEKERLEKQQERLEEKQKELDFQREMNQYYAGLRGILFNTAQAVMSAAANNWPLPAIPLMAAAGAAGAVQYALAARQRPVKKAEGGLISGPSHANGGVPVGNTGIEVEGNEYVIRKSSTEDNIQLLDYINSSQRKLNLSDFIDFFKNDKRTFMNNTSKTRFADGGMLELADNSQFSLGSAFRAYSDRPIVVSVVDINQRQAEVRNVEVLSGLNR